MASHIGRRKFLATLGGAAAAWPLAARAQQAAMPVVGLLSPLAPGSSEHVLHAFRRGLAESGWIEGQNVAIDYRLARCCGARGAVLRKRRLAAASHYPTRCFSIS